MREVCIPHGSLYLEDGNSKGKARGRNRHKNNARVVRNPKERNVGTKEKGPKRDLTSAKDQYVYIHHIISYIYINTYIHIHTFRREV